MAINRNLLLIFFLFLNKYTKNKKINKQKGNGNKRNSTYLLFSWEFVYDGVRKYEKGRQWYLASYEVSIELKT